MTKKNTKYDCNILAKRDFLEIKKDYKIIKIVQNLRNLLIKNGLFLDTEQREKYNTFDDNLREISNFFAEKIKTKQKEIQNGKQ